MHATPFRKVALVHDWLTGLRGGEKVLERFCRLWPDAPLHTLVHVPGSTTSAIEDRTVRTSLLQKLPGAGRYYRAMLPLYPAVSHWRLRDCDLVVSTSSCVGKAAEAPAGVPHVCYCHTPMRYAWHLRDSYFGPERVGRLKSLALQPLLAGLRWWDRATAHRVSHFVCNSRTVQQRIRDCYDRESTVIYPPVDTDYYRPANGEREGFYLVVSAFAPYKRVDLAIEACRRLRRKLVIIGTGQDAARLKALAGPNVTFLGWASDATIRDQFQRCRALLFPGEEDFGIVPVEAQACGAPVLAFGQGGALETVVGPASRGEPTGLFFAEQTAESLAEAIELFEREPFDPQAARRNAVRFGVRRFDDEWRQFLAGVAGGLPARRAA